MPIVLGAVITFVALASLAVAVIAMASHGDVPSFRGMMNHDGMGGMMGGGGQDTSGSSPTEGSLTEAVEIRDFAFQPGNLKVPVGATVTWTNYDAAPHTATANDGSWDTGMLNKGDSAPITFDESGTYDYYCILHPDMKAQISVG